MKVLRRTPLDGKIQKQNARTGRVSNRSTAIQRGIAADAQHDHSISTPCPPKTLPSVQQQLQLHGPKKDFELTSDVQVPNPATETELLIQIQSIGLNPIDWKGPAYNFGLPSFPCVLGRDLVGIVVKKASGSSRPQIGDLVLAVSTDYRDYRKAAFQQFAIASDFNVCRIPKHIGAHEASAIGVAFVTAALTLGVSLGLRSPKTKDAIRAPDLFTLTRSLNERKLPEDIRKECFHNLSESERLKSGDWLAIWGASSTVGFITLQLARMAGVKVICIADAIKHGENLVAAGANVLVHRSNTDEAIQIARAVTGGNLRYGVDTVGKDTANLLQQTLQSGGHEKGSQSHVVGLTGLPKESPEQMTQHKVPVKLFHESPEIGQAIMGWLESLLEADALVFPKIDVADPGGLTGVNQALARLRNGSHTSQRIVVPM